MSDQAASLIITIIGGPGAGKSTLADTAPGPRLILDSEGKAKWTPSPKVYWDPMREDVPTGLTEKDTVVVLVKDSQTYESVMQWLYSGKTPFKSVIVDSLMEIQKRLLDEVVGIKQARTQDWGDVLRKMEGLIRRLRDVTINNGKSIPCVVLVVGSRKKDDVVSAFLQGQISELLPYYSEVQGYLKAVMNADTQQIERRLLIQPLNDIDAKDNPGLLTEKYGPVITNPNLTEMFNVTKDGLAERIKRVNTNS